MYETVAWYLVMLVLPAICFLPLVRFLMVCITNQIKWWRYWWYLRSLPSPPRHWLLGHANVLGPDDKDMHRVIQWHKDYPDLYVLFYGPFIPNITIVNPEFRKMLLKSAEPKSRLYFFLFDWIGDGLLLSSGNKWFRHRKLLTPAFHFDILKSYIPIINEVTHTLLDMWQDHADKGTVFNVFDYSSLYTLDILLRCAFSDSDSNCLAEKDTNPYVKAVCGIANIFIQRICFPPYHSDWIFNLSPMGRKFHCYAKILHNHSEKVIHKRREQLLKDSAGISKKYIDFLDVILSAKDEDGRGLTDVEIREEVDTFMFEGHDTLSSGLSWTLYCLAINPDHQEKCRSEAKEVLSDNDNVSWEDLNRLEYITMCIKESMRLYPPVPIIARQLTQDYVFQRLQDSKRYSCRVSINLNAYNHLPTVWQDPDKFDPLRFTTENIKSRDAFSYTPFSAGPRNCIGQRFAMDELKIAIAHIVNRFYVEVDPSCKVERFHSITLKAKHGITLKLTSV